MKKFPKNPSLNRRLGSVKPQSKIICYCEGKTEAQYIDDFSSSVGRIQVEVCTVAEVGVPSTVVERAIERKAMLEKLARRREADSFDKRFSVWAVFDRDEHPCYFAAIDIAKENGIRIAYSNPCIELWGLMHLMSVGSGYLGHRDAQRRLKTLMSGYSHDRGARFNFESIKNQYDTAHRQAIFLINEAELVGQSYGCPSTSIYHLTELIKSSAQPPRDRENEIKSRQARIAEIEADPSFTSDKKLIQERDEHFTILRELR